MSVRLNADRRLTGVSGTLEQVPSVVGLFAGMFAASSSIMDLSTLKKYGARFREPGRNADLAAGLSILARYLVRARFVGEIQERVFSQMAALP